MSAFVVSVCFTIIIVGKKINCVARGEESAQDRESGAGLFDQSYMYRVIVPISCQQNLIGQKPSFARPLSRARFPTQSITHARERVQGTGSG